MRTCFITGVSSGFGRALSELLIERGDRVVGTLRSEAQAAEFERLAPGRAVGRLLDVRRDADVARVVAEVENDVGPIDVLVNNAGYGYEGTIEEADMADIRAQFDVNVFGALAVIKAVLPFMRARRRGHIINITSMGGIVTFPGLSIYHGSKFALEGLSETLGKEVAQFGIQVTAVEPGGFRTQWAGPSMQRARQSIQDYEPMFAPLRQARAERSGKQPGDPRKAAAAIAAIVDNGDAPVHLLLGSDALSFVRAKLESLNADIERFTALTLSTDATD